ncbi:class D beta-lactamase [Tenacibaculum sp. 1_MG-2023]|uniref:class D beta-lactamase n=1 Tax=Tenacibaculum sp. 1_MG-2023 TaxID=3062653 RepID=UPI0026E25AF2|nr:class D beta-lactamase [Tenacibaculum sp. 1_MG-2023]MDO6675887.1 class D beta-lactamase [Tenacibaculum sp. 1_MG-2023]
MRFSWGFIIIVLLLSCKNEKKSKKEKVEAKLVVNNQFQEILDSTKLEGAILVYDLSKDIYYSNDFDWCEKGNLPASTFKIPNSIIALETGVVKNDSVIFKWNGESRYLKVWEQDLTLKEAFHHSCVPCYQEVARKIGVDRMKSNLAKLDFGSMDVNETTLDNFWLEGKSKINQFKQIEFLKRLHNSELLISERTDSIMKNMIIMSKNNQYVLRGKTGWSVKGEVDNGWFVGYVLVKNKAYFFATNVVPKKSFDMSFFNKERKEVTFKALDMLKILGEKESFVTKQ